MTLKAQGERMQVYFKSHKQSQRFLAIARKMGLLRDSKPNASRLCQAIADEEFRLVPANVDTSIYLDSLDQLHRLTQLALQFDLNEDSLLREIADGNILLALPWSQDYICAMLHAIWMAQDLGHYAVAFTLITILLSSAELTPLVKEQLGYLQSKNWFTIYDRIRAFINAQQPFMVSYRHDSNQVERFDVLMAHFYDPSGERHALYLAAGCEQPNPNEPMRALSHNHSLRLDRILAIEPLHKDWEPQRLGYVQATFQLFGSWVTSYEAKPDDLSDEEILGTPEPCRQITRKVWSSFWLEREILRYGDSALLLTPQPLQSRLRDRLLKTLSRYDLCRYDG
jgi:hypothetical protein